MAVHRKRPRARRTPATQMLSLGGISSSGDLAAAAEVIADEARRLAGAWSRKIPPDISVEVSGREAVISSQVGPAYPAETRARHPLFGNRSYWYGPPGEPFLRPAAEAKADAAAVRYSNVIDRLAREAGFH